MAARPSAGPPRESAVCRTASTRLAARVDTFTQLTLNGLTLGSGYALIALGYSLVYGILKLLNFAHGDVVTVGAFIGFGMLHVLGGSTDPVVPVWLLLVLITTTAMAGCAALGVAIRHVPHGHVAMPLDLEDAVPPTKASKAPWVNTTSSAASTS